VSDYTSRSVLITSAAARLVRIMVDADMRLLDERIGLRVPASVGKQGLPTGL
jgi:hypothetical protein